MSLEQVVAHFPLGPLSGTPARVAGGLSNEMWRVSTSLGDFAIKRMVVNAHLPSFVDNVEAAFRVEQRAYAAGVPMPAPVVEPGSGRALVRVDGDLYRVHQWVDGQAAQGSSGQAAELLAGIHAVGRPRWETALPLGWNGERWGAEIGHLAERVARSPGRLLVVDSHRDLDRKNALRRADGRLLALDWDAAGPTGAAQEAVGVALDWAGGDRYAFAEAVAVYRRRSGVVIDPEPWVFGGWVAGLGGWLDYNADHRADDTVGRAEIKAARRRLREFADDLDSWVDAVR
ncbi:aminoglycoside phosphotransferase family protein [Actinoplanes sp. M2I2]|uniref:aminoglycoside phosphotransferase family protein n=1 Tax=Actinoplanes sp. M2I2 TaxID=1734444 RepID=UPI00202025A1|nr:aminoglycoside phosphotransferase family protein [Actinoplanes sp. M2I2]